MRYGSVQDFMSIPVLGLRPEASATPPTDPTAGRLWTDTSVTPAVVRWHDGTKWWAANGTSIPVGFITNELISPTAGIQLSKLAVDPLARANHTGTQTASTISDFDARVRTSRLDQMAAPTANVDFNGVRLTNLGNPTAAGDAVTKSYVDNARAGVSVKDPVRIAATGNVNLASPGATLDGVSLTNGDRFLAPLQNTGTENGIYVYNGPTTAATRATDADSASEVFDGSMVAVADGSKAGYQYIQTVTSSGTPGTWTQNWIVFTMGGQTYSAGNGLTISGTVFSLDTPVSIANGGTGATTMAGVRANIGATTRYAADLGALSTGVTLTVTHNLGTLDVHAMFRTTADGRSLTFDWAPKTTNTIEVYPDLSYAAGGVRIVVLG